MNTDDNQLPILELFFSSTEPSEVEGEGDNKLIWKDILREGEFAITPGRGKRVPFQVIPEGQSSATDRIISMSELESAFEDQAFEHVGIPLADSKGSHDNANDLLNNAGYVKKLRRKVKYGITYLQAGLGFTEPDVKGRVQRGSIPNVSSGIYFDHIRKADAKKFPVALNHVLLTKNPWINKLEPFKEILASDENPDPEFESYQFAEGEDDDTKTVEVVWDDKDGSRWLTSKLQETLNPETSAIDDGRPQTATASYYVEDVSPVRNLALVQEYFRGVTSKFLIPFTRNEDAIEPAPNIRWTQVREAMIAASDEVDDDPFLLADRRKKFTEMSADKVREKVEIALSDMLGKDANKYQVAEVALDNRCLIVDKENLVSFAADFSLSPDGVIFLSVSSEWERLNNPKEKKKDEPKTMKTNPVTNTIMFADTPEGRVAKARHERKLVFTR
jgi:hypothetical protein